MDGKKDRVYANRKTAKHLKNTVTGSKVEAKRGSLYDIFHLASFCNAGYEFSSKKQVEHLHLQNGIFKNAWRTCPKSTSSKQDDMCSIFVCSLQYFMTVTAWCYVQAKKKKKNPKQNRITPLRPMFIMLKQACSQASC